MILTDEQFGKLLALLSAYENGKTIGMLNSITNPDLKKLFFEVEHSVNGSVGKIPLSILGSPDWRFAESGYWQSPDGLMIQWGYSVANQVTTTFYFPKTFISVYAATATSNVRGSSGDSAGGIMELTNSYIKTRQSAAYLIGVYYIVIGTWK